MSGDPKEIRRAKQDEALAVAEEIHAKSIQDQALEYVPDAMQTLGSFARGQKVGEVKPNASVTRASARDIIEFAGGRPETRDPRVGSDGGGVQIVINQYGSEKVEKIMGDLIPNKSRLVVGDTPNDSLAILEQSIDTVKKEFTVPEKKHDAGS